MADENAETPGAEVATPAPPPPPNRAARRKAAKAKKPPKLDQSVREAIDRAKSGRRPPAGDGVPDGATVLTPTPEQIAQAEAAAQAQAQGLPPTGGGDIPPMDPSQMSPELLEQLAAMSGGGAQAGGAAAALANRNKRRHKKYVDLEGELAVFLMMPAVPCEMAGDQFCAMHFAQQGPMLAHRLTAYAETHDATFELLSKIVEAGGMVALIVAVAAYALPPMIHHGLPAPQGLRRMYGVPPKAQKAEPQEVEQDG